MTDDALIEAMARAMYESDGSSRWHDSVLGRKQYTREAKAALAIARPIIEAQERERCARIAEFRYWSSALGTDGIPKAIAAAIRETGDE